MWLPWLLIAYGVGWYRGRQGWPFLWRKATPTTPTAPRTPPIDPKPIVLPSDEPEKMAERLNELVPGFSDMPPEIRERVIARFKDKASNQLGLLTRP